MKPAVHIVLSFSMGVAFWIFTKSVYAALLCLATGVLVDLDHILEYAIHFGAKGFSIKKFFHVCHEMLFDKLYLVLHSAEVVIALWLVAIYTKNVYVYAAAAGYSSHLIIDFFGNPLHIYSYFIFRRIVRKFNTNKLVKKGHPRWKG